MRSKYYSCAAASLFGRGLRYMTMRSLACTCFVCQGPRIGVISIDESLQASLMLKLRNKPKRMHPIFLTTSILPSSNVISEIAVSLQAPTPMVVFFVRPSTTFLYNAPGFDSWTTPYFQKSHSFCQDITFIILSLPAATTFARGPYAV